MYNIFLKSAPDIRYFKVTENVVEDAFLHVETIALQQDICPLVNFQEMAAAQHEDPELLQVQASSSSLTVELIPVKMSDTKICVTLLLVYPALLFHLTFTVPCLIPFPLFLILKYEPLNTTLMLRLFCLALMLIIECGLAPVMSMFKGTTIHCYFTLLHISKS